MQGINGIEIKLRLCLDFAVLLFQGNGVTDNLPLIIEAGINILVGLMNGIIEALPQLIEMLPEIIVTIVNTLTQNLPKIIQMGAEILVKLGKGILSMLKTLVKNCKEVVSSVVKVFMELPSKMVDIGVNLVKGLWNGIKDTTQWVLDKIKGFGQSVLNGIKSIFGIASPSKLMRDQVGKNLALGIGEGFEDEMRSVTEQMQNALPTSFETNATITGTGATSSESLSFETIMEAFKEALYGVKVEMDDEEMGKFVDKTVTRLVYT